ncbi:uncharacterized protein LOC113563908 [Drosophila erecta]|uniref:uncharacterized protein LOC113563908 n=1 Tax=Drosophila erecta TaxID=7220 RepID=UPI000F055BBE|nr:uncharacterized protein LOC113563908 [Drosophila erecta]
MYTHSKEDEQSIMMLPMEVTEPSETSDGTEEIRRRKRSVNKNKTYKQIIDLSKFMLISVENFAAIGQTEIIFNGRQLPCTLFTATKLSFKQKAWISLIILGSIGTTTAIAGNYVLLLKNISNILKSCSAH